jgi:outer membrane receptor for ferrienterochelin and colicin
VGNPDLKTEQNWTQILGTQWESKPFEWSLSTYGQWRRNPRVRLGSTLSNLKDSRVFGLLSSFALVISEHFELKNSLTLTHSEIDASEGPFPYLPHASDVLTLTYKTEIQPFFLTNSKKFPLEFSTLMKGASSRKTALVSANELPAYVSTDLALKIDLNRNHSLFFRVENLFNHPIELIQGYPIQRNLSFAWTAEL